MEIARGVWLARSALALVLASVATAPAAAAPAATSVPGLPDDVAAFFAEQAPEVLEATELHGTAAGSVHEVFAWSEAYLSGAAGGPTVSLDEWIAPVERLGEPVGTITAYRPAPDEPATFAATSDDAELAAALLGVRSGSRLVLDAPADAWFALIDGTVTPLDEHATELLPAGRATLEELQPSVVERYASMRAQPDDVTAPVGSRTPDGSVPQPWLLGAGIAAVVIGLLAVLGLVLRARRRRRAA
ncbi:hypothetical protein SAMN04487783_1048 [Agrococcus baldri]|uniref:LPXTG-motif cell wall anchor domain-containing protein n=1 Tax=Agrococcus baldri TaxID=153730 RepID=A0AA94KZ91_9MICO|nr:hypothetical protein [Agrococcus baldri]SFS08087.1 hypothetical protein SAMN04487783_1048 [Agrococcus baldri]